MLTRGQYALLVLLICSPRATAQSAPNQPFHDDANTIALWHLDGDGSNAASAASASAVVQLRPGAAFITEGGRFGGALHVNGAAAFVSDADIPELDAAIAGTWDFTLEAWVKPSPGDVNPAVLTTTGILQHYAIDVGGNRGFDWRIDNLDAGTGGRPTGTPGLLYFRSGDPPVVDNHPSLSLLAGRGGEEIALRPDTWTHVALTRRASTWSLWINGQMVATIVSAWAVPDSSAPLILGALQDFIRPMTGMIDEVRISKVARYEAGPPELVFIPERRPPAHLFLDDHEIASMSGLTRVLHQPARRGMVVDHDRPWEDWAADFPTVMRDDAGFHMYYRALYREGAPPVPEDPSQQGVSTTCYAFSTDGLHWTKPNLRLREIKGTLDNNVLPTAGVSAAIWQPLHPDPGRRYLFQAGGAAFGSNPVSGWVPYGMPPLRGGGLNYEPHQELFAAYGQTEQPRTIYRYVSPDLASWADEGKVLECDALDHRLPYDTDEFYGMGVQQEGTLTIGFAWVFHTDRTDPDYATPYSASVWRKGLIDIQLAASRDGKRWTRVGYRQTWLPLGLEGSFDDGMVFIGGPGVRVGDELWFYYGAWDGDHLTFTASGRQFEERLREGRIGLAVIRRDGFLSLRSGDQEAVLTTRTYPVNGERLVINAAAAGGEIRVELLDEAGQVLPGYSADQCDTIRTDRVAIPVRWSANEDLTALGSRLIRVRFRMRSADLYSFTLAALKCGDFDADLDVDGDDFAIFRSCQSGPAVPQPDPYCRQADLDAEGDVDMDDFGLFQQAFTGAGRG